MYSRGEHKNNIAIKVTTLSLWNKSENNKKKKKYQLKNYIDIAYCHTFKLKNGKKNRDLGHKYI